jgi:signal peptidase I
MKTWTCDNGGDKNRVFMRLLKKIGGLVGWGALGAVFIIASFVLIGVRQGWEFDAVLSGSMEPVLNVGGLVIIRPVDTSRLHTGDVISFKLPGIDTPICHRVIDVQQTKEGLFFQTRGDANEDADQNLVPADSVTGMGVLHLPYVGRLTELAKTGKSPVFILGKKLPVAVLVIFGMGILFIGLTLRDTLEDLLFPSRKSRREMLRKRKERLLKRRQSFRIR